MNDPGSGERFDTAPSQLIAIPSTGTEDFHVGMIIFDDMTNLDFAGPNNVFAAAPAARIHVLAKTRDPVSTDSGGRVLADMTLDEAPDLDMLFIGGGPGSTALMEDAEMLAFLVDRAPRAKLITSVCTGALILGAAGLLRGYRATTHWAAMDVLPFLGAIPVHERVVVDRDRITGGGVTAGIDFGLTVVAKLWGDELAQMIQLGLEYNPQPPFNAGSLGTAPAQVGEKMRGVLSNVTERRIAAAKRVALTFN
jgi:cyclohexyl-isocyanide hydratase